MKSIDRIIQIENGEIVLERTISIRVGALYHISPSYGYAGISDGVVKVVKMVFPEDMDEETRRDTVGLWMDCCIINPDEESEDYQEEVKMITQAPWIFYEYIHPAPVKGSENEGVLRIPFRVFIDHISTL